MQSLINIGIGFSFYAVIIMLLTLVFILVTCLVPHRKERKSTAYHETAHALIMMVTGMGFESASVERNNFVHGQITFQKVHYRVNRTDSTVVLHTKDEQTRHMLMAMVAGYVAEAELAGKAQLPQKLENIEGSDLQRADEILENNPHLYSYSTKEAYLDEVIAETKHLLALHHELHLRMSDELYASKTLPEEKAWELASRLKSGMKNNPYLNTLIPA